MSELGETLKNAREDKGISLSELQDATKIQKRYLLAIERGEYGQLPGRFYARAFIKSYAEAVGIDPDQLFEQYNSEVPKPQNEIGQLPSRADRRGQGTARVSRGSGSGPSKRPSAVLPSILAAIVIIGLFVIIWMAFQHAHKGGQGAADPSGSQVQYKQNKSAQKNKDNSKKKSQSSNTKKKSSSSTSNNNQNKQKKQKTKSKPVLTKTGESNGVSNFTLEKASQFKLKMDVTGGNCWIEVRKSGATGEKIVYKTIQSGGSITKDLSGDKQIYIKVGNAAHVKTFIDDTPLTYPSTNTVQNFLITFNKAKNAS